MQTDVPDDAMFHRWLSSGLGRAILYAQENDVSRFHDVLLDHCLRCYSVDPQWEGTHAGYILELIDLLPDGESYYEAVLHSLGDRSAEGWDRGHRFALVRMMAEGGYERARKAMYESYVPHVSDSEGIGVEFVVLDGIAGLLFIAAKHGELLLAGEQLDVGWAYSAAEEKCGETEVARALEEAAKVDRAVDAWYRACLAARQRTAPSRLDTLKQLRYAELRQRFGEYPTRTLLLWGRHAPATEISAAASGLLNARPAEEIETHLAIFADREFPGDIGVLVAHARSEVAAIAWRAAAALQRTVRTAVRELAFELVARGSPGRRFANDMLTANFLPGDHEIALSWFEREQEVETRHALGMGLRHLIETHPSDGMEGKIQLSLYEWGPCSFCRQIAVERLIKRGELSPQMRAECVFDNNDEIRALVV